MLSALPGLSLAVPSLLSQVPSEPSILDVGSLLVSALSGGQYALLGAAALLLVVLVARKVGAKALPVLATPRGGAVLALLVSGLTSLVARLSSGAPLSMGVVLEAVAAALSVSGLWSVGKNLVAPPKQQTQGVAVECTPLQIANGTCKP